MRVGVGGSEDVCGVRLYIFLHTRNIGINNGSSVGNSPLKAYINKIIDEISKELGDEINDVFYVAKHFGI